MTDPHHHHHHVDTIERESSGIGAIIGVLVAIAALVLLVWLIFGLGGDSDVEAPAPEVDITVETPDAGGQGT